MYSIKLDMIPAGNLYPYRCWYETGTQVHLLSLGGILQRREPRRLLR